MIKKQQILERALLLFSKYGLRTVSMKRIAEETGISTKTLYKNFVNKEYLIKDIIETGIKDDKAELMNIQNDRKFAIEELLLIRKYFYIKTKDLYPGLIEDLRKYYPSSYELLEEFFIYYREEWLLQNLKRGIKEGHYKKNIELNILSKYLLEISLIALSRSSLLTDNVNLGKIYYVLFENFMYGITTDNGKVYLDKNFKKFFSN